MNPRIQVLGSVRAWLGDQELHLGSPRQKGLLALLALAGGQPLSRQHLTDALWGEHPPTRSANVIQVYVGRLRRVLEPHRPARGQSRVLPAVGDGYALAVDADAVDALRMRRALASAGAARRDNRHASVRALLAPVLNEWREPLLGTAFFADQQLATALVEEHRRAVVWNAAAAIAEGDAAEVLTALEETATANPWDETVQALRIRALLAVGRRADAINAYHRVNQALRDHLGVGSGPVLAEAFTLALAPGSSEHRQPELPEPFIAAQLPARTGQFTGRTGELSALKAILSGPADRTRIVCLEGGPGVGKTSLALELAHAMSSRYGDGQLFIDLRGHDRSGAVGQSEALVYLLRSLGVDESRLPSGSDELAARYRTAVSGRRLLVLLDNAAGTDQVLALLPPTPSSGVIITSRHSLTALATHHSVHLREVEPLSTVEARSLLGRTVGEERVAAGRGAADTLVDFCEGLPLALRIVAARLVADPDRTLDSMAAELADEKERLGGLSVEGEARSVRSAFQLLVCGSQGHQKQSGGCREECSWADGVGRACRGTQRPLRRPFDGHQAAIDSRQPRLVWHSRPAATYRVIDAI